MITVQLGGSWVWCIMIGVSWDLVSCATAEGRLTIARVIHTKKFGFGDKADWWTRSGVRREKGRGKLASSWSITFWRVDVRATGGPNSSRSIRCNLANLARPCASSATGAFSRSGSSDSSRATTCALLALIRSALAIAWAREPP
eukprot:1190657-Prorocentrum_minimum.AAC.6